MMLNVGLSGQHISSPAARTLALPFAVPGWRAGLGCQRRGHQTCLEAQSTLLAVSQVKILSAREQKQNEEIPARSNTKHCPP